MYDDRRRFADHRTSIHEGQASQRKLSKDYEQIGLAGEEEFARQFGQMHEVQVDTSDRIGGDGGRDFLIGPGVVDVKTARKPIYLLLEQKPTRADIVVLARYDDETRRATLLGWQWVKTIQKYRVRDMGFGVLSHAVPLSHLRPIRDLKRMCGQPVV